MIIPFHRSYLRNPCIVAGLVACAVCLWFEAVGEMREMQRRVRFSQQLSDKLSQLQTACDAIARSR